MRTSTFSLALLLVSLGLAGCSAQPAEPHMRTPPAAATDRGFFNAANILAVQDLDATLRWYEQKLGFRDPWNWEGGNTFGGIRRGHAHLMFQLDPALARRVKGHYVMLFVEGIDALYSDHQRRGARVIDPIANRPWGFREYVVEDLNGYRLRIAEPLPCEDHDGELCGFSRF